MAPRWMFWAVQQNIHNRTEGERNSEKTVNFTKTLIGWFDVTVVVVVVAF